MAQLSFRRAGELLEYNAEGFGLSISDSVIAETEKGLRLGVVKSLSVQESGEVEKKQLGKILRKATPSDMAQHKKNLGKGKFAFDFCIERIKHRKLPMKLLEVEYAFSSNFAIFYFSANGRVDFRDIVKDLASRLRIRVEMKQVGVRDELKILGAIGVCGRETCCSSFLCKFSPISIKMAKNQNLPLNPSKVSGVCGRLLCCLE